MLARDFDNACQGGIHLRIRAFHLDDQQGFNIQRITGFCIGLAYFNRQFVHKFHGHRNDAGPDNGRDTGPRLLAARKAEQNRPRPFRRAQNPHAHFGDNAKLPLRPDNQSEQIIARSIHGLAADLDHRAIHQHHFDTQHIIGCRAVFQAMRAAGIHTDIAANRAGQL